MDVSTENNPRWDRIVRLLNELEYEVTRGIMEHEIDERMGKIFFVPSPTSRNAVVECRFETRTTENYPVSSPQATKLRVIK